MGFPPACTRESCVRLTVDNRTSHNAEGLKVPIYHNSEEEIMTAIYVCILDPNFLTTQHWLNTEWYETNRMMATNSSYVHSRFITVFFGFTDDFYVLLVPSYNSSFALEIQSESRIGQKDFGRYFDFKP